MASCGCGLHLRGCQLVEELLPLELALPPRRERVLHEHLGLQRTLLQLLHRASRGALAAQALAIGSSEGRREPAHDPSQHATVARSAAHVERPFAGVPPAAGRSGPSAPPRGRACPPAPRAAWPAGLTRLGRRARFRASLGGPAARGRADSPARQLRPRHRAPAIRLASNRLDAVSWRRRLLPLPSSRTHCPRRRIRASPSRLRLTCSFLHERPQHPWLHVPSLQRLASAKRRPQRGPWESRTAVRDGSGCRSGCVRC